MSDESIIKWKPPELDKKNNKSTQSLRGDRSEHFWENYDIRISYYRDNIHRFCTEYLGISLRWWQKVVIYLMAKCGASLFLASRGLGKSFLTMVFCIAVGTLYPGIVIVVAAPTKEQAKKLIEKAREIQKNYPMAAREIEDIKTQKEESWVKLTSGAVIKTLVAGEGARGTRANIVILDEREWVSPEIKEKIFMPMLSQTRKPPYLLKSEYASFAEKEKNRFIELSSIGAKTGSLYGQFEQYTDFIGDGDLDYSVFSLPYQFGVEGGIITEDLIKKMLKENKSGLEAFKQEMEVIPFSESEASLLTFDAMNKVRNGIIPLIPITDEEYLRYRGNLKDYKFYQKKPQNEIRILSMDVALMGGRKNDMSIFQVYRLIRNGDEYIIELAYIEGINGENIDPQVLRLKQLYYDLECDSCVLDALGVGQSIFDLSTKKTIDPTRGKIYPAWNAKNDLDNIMNSRTLDKTAEPVIYSIKVSGANATEVHGRMIAKARHYFERKKVLLLRHEDSVISALDKQYGYLKLKSSNSTEDNELARRMIMPFVQTSELIKESISAQIIRMPSGGCKIDDKSKRKDRTMCMLYAMYYIDLLEMDLQFIKTEFDYKKLIGIAGGGNGGKSAPLRQNMFGNKFNGFGGFRGFGR